MRHSVLVSCMGSVFSDPVQMAHKIEKLANLSKVGGWTNKYFVNTASQKDSIICRKSKSVCHLGWIRKHTSEGDWCTRGAGRGEAHLHWPGARSTNGHVPSAEAAWSVRPHVHEPPSRAGSACFLFRKFSRTCCCCIATSRSCIWGAASKLSCLACCRCRCRCFSVCSRFLFDAKISACTWSRCKPTTRGVCIRGETYVSLNTFQPSRDPSTGWRCHSTGAGGASQY